MRELSKKKQRIDAKKDIIIKRIKSDNFTRSNKEYVNIAFNFQLLADLTELQTKRYVQSAKILDNKYS